MKVLSLAAMLLAPAIAQAGSFNSLDIASDPRVLIEGASRYAGVGSVGLVRGDGFVSGCTGSLVAADIVLTAGHCLDFAQPGYSFRSPQIGSGEIRTVTGYVAQSFSTGGRDIMLLRLDRAVEGAETYGIYRGGDEVGREFEMVGVGRLGLGETGVDRGGDRLPGDDAKRIVRNRWETTLDAVIDASDPTAFFGLGFFFDPADALVADFDGPGPVNDAFGRLLGLDSPGLGELESLGGPGDSGAPSFLFDDAGVALIAGIHSFSLTGGVLEATPTDRPCGSPVDLDRSCNDSSWGDIAGDARVSRYASWIDSVLGGGTAFIDLNFDPPPPPPVPAPAALALFGLGAAALMRRRVVR